MKPTGKTRLRHSKTFWGRPVLVLQMEFKYRTFDYPFFDGRDAVVWRDATIEDVSNNYADKLVNP